MHSIMRLDQMEYGKQIREIRRAKRAGRKAQGLPPSSWAERLGEGDRLHPVYTICFYHGSGKWDGPRSRKDMMAFGEGTEAWQGRFHDYGMTLFCADEPGDLGRFGTGLKQLLEVLKLRQDKEALAGLWCRGEFAHLDRETMEAMAVLTDSAEILDKMDGYENKEGGGYSMCLAVEEMRRDWKAEGIAEGMEKGMQKGKAEGIIETALELGMPESAILDRLQQKLALPLERAQEYFAMYSGQTV